MALKAVLFDMDGVIVDTEPLHKEAYHLMFQKVGITVSPALYNSYTGKSTLEICEDLKQQFSLEHKATDLVTYKRAFFKELFFDEHSNLQLIDGVHDLIRNYYDNDITLVLASSASMFTINAVFKRFGLGKYFVGKISGAELKASKPHPEIFIKAAEISGFTKQQCMVIEDSTNGLQAAFDANIFCVAYKSEHSKAQDYSLANLLVDDFKDIYFDKITTHFLN